MLPLVAQVPALGSVAHQARPSRCRRASCHRGSLSIFFGLRGYLDGVESVFTTTTAVRGPLRGRAPQTQHRGRAYTDLVKTWKIIHMLPECSHSSEKP